MSVTPLVYHVASQLAASVDHTSESSDDPDLVGSCTVFLQTHFAHNAVESICRQVE